MTDYIIVFSTAGSLEEARRIAHRVLEQRLAACVNIVPQVQSIYRWEGKVEQSEECLLWIKTSRQLLNRVRDSITETHSYRTPEIVSIRIEDGSPDYLQWLADCLGK
jgi:periplasmic divalent cation tolerance protein